MKKFDDSTFDINMTTMRELNPEEVDQVGGGTVTTLTTSTPACTSVTVPITVTLTLAFSCFDACGSNQQK